jgi:hypothetical protein
VPAAGAQQRELVGEVPVDGDPPDAGAVGDVGDRRRVRADRLMQLDRRVDDALPCLVLALRPRLEGVGPTHGTECIAI